MQDITTQLLGHRSIRKFRDQPLAAGQLEQLVSAGQAAASSSFVQSTTVIRITEPALRQSLQHLAANQPYVSAAAEFLVFCADFHRLKVACAQQNKTLQAGYIEQLIIASVDAGIFAQNVAIAAEAQGLGICYIGALRNRPQEVAELLELPDQVFALFGMCIGHPAQDPQVKPRLPQSLILRENRYAGAADPTQIDAFDRQLADYYRQRSRNAKHSSWSEEMADKVADRESRPHMLAFLQQRGLATR